MKYLALLVLLLASTAQATLCSFQVGRSLCRGDLDCDCRVEVNEIQSCINASLYEGDACRPNNPVCANVESIAHCDSDCNFDITVAELIQIVNTSLAGCFSPCYSGFNYPTFGSSLCTRAIFNQLYCQTSGGPCSRTQCPSC